jgi:hypothetical protein
MQASLYRRIVLKVSVVLVALSIGLFAADSPIQAATVFDPQVDITLSSSAANATADITLDFDLSVDGAGGNQGDEYNFSSLVTFLPQEAFVAPGPGNPGFVAANPDLGDVVGTLDSATFLGLINGACSSFLNLPFSFLNATVDTTDTIAPLSIAAAPTTNVAERGKGTLANMRDDDQNGDANGIAGIPNHVDEFPSYVNTLFTPEDGAGAGNAIQPLARYSSSILVDGNAIVLQFVQFSPGALGPKGLDGVAGNADDGFQPPHPLSDLGDVSLGYPSVIVLQDPTVVSWSSITDFCSELGTVTVLFGESRENPCNGNVAPPCDGRARQNTPCNAAGSGGLPACGSGLTNTTEDRYRNPGTNGTYFYSAYGQSARDSDGDGLENSLDACPTVASTNLAFARGAGAGADPDTDADRLPRVAAGCDDNDSVNTGAGNWDGDTEPTGAQAWQNGNDNCPLNADLDTDGGGPDLAGENIETEIDPATPEWKARPRGGPDTDTRGDLCDDVDDRADGTFYTVFDRDAFCIGGTDADGDGFCSDDPDNNPPDDPNDTAGPGAAIIPESFLLVKNFPLATTGSGTAPAGASGADSLNVSNDPPNVCNDGIDNDGDGDTDQYGGDPDAGCRPDHSSATQFPARIDRDTDGDGTKDYFESWIGTDVMGRCQVGRPFGNIPSNDWPHDFHGGSMALEGRGIINGQDLGALLAPTRYLDSSPGDGIYDQRYDLLPGRSDAFGTWINGQDFGSFLAPVRILDQGPCTKHPDYQFWE